MLDCEEEGDVIITNGKNMTQKDSTKISKNDDGILTKYGTINSKGSNDWIFFDTSYYKEGEEIHIKIKVEYFFERIIYY